MARAGCWVKSDNSNPLGGGWSGVKGPEQFEKQPEAEKWSGSGLPPGTRCIRHVSDAALALWPVTRHLSIRPQSSSRRGLHLPHKPAFKTVQSHSIVLPTTDPDLHGCPWHPGGDVRAWSPPTTTVIKHGPPLHFPTLHVRGFGGGGPAWHAGALALGNCVAVTQLPLSIKTLAQCTRPAFENFYCCSLLAEVSRGVADTESPKPPEGRGCRSWSLWGTQWQKAGVPWKRSLSTQTPRTATQVQPVRELVLSLFCAWCVSGHWGAGKETLMNFKRSRKRGRNDNPFTVVLVGIFLYHIEGSVALIYSTARET